MIQHQEHARGAIFATLDWLRGLCGFTAQAAKGNLLEILHAGTDLAASRVAWCDLE